MALRRILWLFVLVAFLSPPAYATKASAMAHDPAPMTLNDCDHTPPPWSG